MLRVPGGACLCSYLLDSIVVFLSFGNGLLYFSTTAAFYNKPEIESIYDFAFKGSGEAMQIQLFLWYSKKMVKS